MAQLRLPSLLAFAVGLCFASIWQASAARAHSTGWSEGTADALVLTFYYVGGGPVVDADARIFAPNADAAPFQIGRTDRLGRILFVPDRPGLWRVNVVDSEGHEMVASTAVAAAGEVRDPAVGFTGALLLSLTANLFLGIAWWRLRQRGAVENATSPDESATRSAVAPSESGASSVA